jgi:hypothetical protein
VEISPKKIKSFPYFILYSNIKVFCLKKGPQVTCMPTFNL